MPPWILSGHGMDPLASPVHRKVGGFSFTVEESVSTHIYAATTIAQTLSNIPGVIGIYNQWHREGGTEAGFNYTRTQIASEEWKAGVVDNNERSILYQNSGDALDPNSAALAVDRDFGSSGKKWWFSIENGVPAVKTGNFTFEVWTTGMGAMLYQETFDMTLIGT